jgi:serine/threonine-protein kinase
MMYECLTGEVPFRANNYLGIISQVLTHTASPPSAVRPELGIPDAVEAVVMRAMAKDRTQRYQAMADLERDLERLLAGDQNVGLPLASGAPAATQLPEPPKRWLLGVAAVITLGVGVSFALSRPPGGDAQQAPTRPPAVPPAASGSPSPPAAAGAPPASAPERAPVDRAEHPRGASSHPHGARDRHASPAAAKAPPPASDSVKRGVLPSGSREAYPDQ